MRRLLINGIAWVLSTAAAGALSWWGVHTVIAATAYVPPPALPVTAAEGKGKPETAPGPSPAHPSGAPASPAVPGSGAGGDGEGEEPPAGATGDPVPAPTPTGGGTAAAGGPRGNTGTDVEDYTVDGGRVSFDMKEDRAELVSADPAPGWRMQVWKHPQWIRVSFTSGDREIAVFCSWYQHAPLVQVEEH